MFTLATVVQEPEGEQELIQRNAIQSWLYSVPSPWVAPQILFVGEHPYSFDYYSDYSFGNTQAVFFKEGVVPRLNVIATLLDAFDHYSRRGIVNSDIMLWGVDRAIQLVEGNLGLTKYLLVGRRRNVAGGEEVLFTRNWRKQMRQMYFGGEYGHNTQLDFFVFRGLDISDAPPFEFGRVRWDNWMTWKAKQEGVPIVDVTSCVMCLHQNHKKNRIMKDNQFNLELYRKVTGGDETIGLGKADVVIEKANESGSVVLRRGI